MASNLKEAAVIIPVYRDGEYKIWGVTYHILQPLIPLLLAEKWEI